MANVKNISVDSAVPGLTIYIIIRRESDQAYLDNSTGNFSTTPTSAYVPMTEDAIIKGHYYLNESRTVWIDGQYTVRSYSQAGASPNPSVDQGVGAGSFYIYNDSIAELEAPITAVQPVIIQAPPATTAYTAYDLIVGALRLLGLGRAENYDATNDIANNLSTLNQILSKLAAGGILTQQTVDEGFALVNGIEHYTIGLNQTPSSNVLDTARPIRIESAYIVDSTLTHYPVEIITREEFNNIPDQEVSDSRPNYLFYDIGIAQQANNVGTINLYPVPDGSSTYTLHIVSVKPIGTFINTTDACTFDLSFIDYIMTAMAIRLAPEYGVAVSQELKDQHTENTEIIELLSWRQPVMKPSKLMGGTLLNIYSSTPNQ